MGMKAMGGLSSDSTSCPEHIWSNTNRFFVLSITICAMMDR